jgi:hypothetical protein
MFFLSNSFCPAMAGAKPPKLEKEISEEEQSEVIPAGQLDQAALALPCQHSC